MNQQLFIEAIKEHAKRFGVNPLLLLSGVEGLYTFKDVPLNGINYDFLDSLILTIFALRIGDEFSAIAVKNITDNNETVQAAAINELTPLSHEDFAASGNKYLQSFATILAGKAVIFKYHIKALEVAGSEIGKLHQQWDEKSIGVIIMHICKEDESGYLTAFFRGEGT